MSLNNQTVFEERNHSKNSSRPGDIRNQYQRDRARILHSAAFRRLQGKTQVMGTGEGDFHRTRLTHSIECAQISSSLADILNSERNGPISDQERNWLPPRDLIEAAGFAHDLGHPPFGHRGENSLDRKMVPYGGFEGNGQTLRILCKLEKYRERGRGILPTRRLLLAILKYPAPISVLRENSKRNGPPKAYLDEEAPEVAWAIDPFVSSDQTLFVSSSQGKTLYHTLDCSILELADDIAYGIHDIEDIIARKLASETEVRVAINTAFQKVGSITQGGQVFESSSVANALLSDSFSRKQMIAALVNLFVTRVHLKRHEKFEHPLLDSYAVLPLEHAELLKGLKYVAYNLVISRAKLQQLEARGERIVSELFDAILTAPDKLIPKATWEDGDETASIERRVCDYIAGMTDSYAEKVYSRLFIPGYGTSNDEL